MQSLVKTKTRLAAHVGQLAYLICERVKSHLIKLGAKNTQCQLQSVTNHPRERYPAVISGPSNTQALRRSIFQHYQSRAEINKKNIALLH